MGFLKNTKSLSSKVLTLRPKPLIVQAEQKKLNFGVVRAVYGKTVRGIAT